eukprot:5751866-Heterocapsa_arctica.AAC.1
MRLVARGRSSRGLPCTTTAVVRLADGAVLRLGSRTRRPPSSGPSGPYTFGARRRSRELDVAGRK